MKERLDVLLLKKGLVDSRQKAKALIMEGKVSVNGKTVDKAGTKVDENSDIKIKGRTNPYVSRGGMKLETAIKNFGLSFKDLTCADIGASTGGFTDCMLKHGAKKVYAVDVGKGQLDWKLRNDERVKVLEGVNARYLSKEHIDQELDAITIDVSFISLEKIIPSASAFLKDDGFIVALIKPQFELSKREVSKGRGVVREPALRERAVKKIIEFVKKMGLVPVDITRSHPPGPKGNVEFLLLIKKDGKPVDESKVRAVVYGAPGGT